MWVTCLFQDGNLPGETTKLLVWCTLASPALWMQWHECTKSEVSVGYIVRPCLQIKLKKYSKGRVYSSVLKYFTTIPRALSFILNTEINKYTNMYIKMHRAVSVTVDSVFITVHQVDTAWLASFDL